MSSRRVKNGVCCSIFLLFLTLIIRISHLETQIKDTSQTLNNEDQEKMQLARKKLEVIVFDLTAQVKELNNKNSALQRDLDRYRYVRLRFCMPFLILSRYDSNDHLSKFEELTLTLTQTRELAEKLKLENSWLVSENSQYKLLEKDVIALRKENKQLLDSEKSTKKKELEATQKLQNYIYEATNKVDDMETEIQKQTKV